MEAPCSITLDAGSISAGALSEVSQVQLCRKNDHLKVLIGCVRENNGLGRGLFALQSFFTFKKRTRTFISNWITSFKSSCNIAIYDSAALPMILLICPYENLHAYSFLR